MADPIVPDRMEKHFEAAMSAKLLTVQTIEHMGTGWLIARLLAQWLRLCDDTVADMANARINTDRFRIGAHDDGVDPATKSELGVAIFSLKHDFDHFAAAVAPMGIDLKDLEDRGHVRVFGNMYTRIFGDNTTDPPTPPSLTLMSALRLLMYEADKLKFTHKRAILLLDEPEFVTPVFEGDDYRMEKWVCMVQGASYQFHHAIISIALRLPNIRDPNPVAFPASMAAVNGVYYMTEDADMTVIVRSPGPERPDFDGIARFIYRKDYEPPRPDFQYREEACVYRLGVNGRAITTIHTYR